MSRLLAGFESPGELERALQELGAADLPATETYTPMPMSEEGGSPLPAAMFVAGILGFAGFFLLMTYADVHAYPLDIGGRPRFAWPAFVPIAFELGVLCAMAVGFFGYFAICRMPKLYDPVDECESFRRASRDEWFLTVRIEDARHGARVRAVLEPLHPASIEEIAE